ncbi:glutaredoxin family protein [Catalinimonas niigatensis]|uniref:glutaredoxin family protein n=1 Tax=Catalinimonas niigatensis TaxID=1397264 RepID=UPI0026667155|nr:glutaredoxin domain-containing protein [Catalinimonas niigatensis]WPP51252.1 glutaredoxin domain-containing protein [Catalinimonas niigatensis]
MKWIKIIALFILCFSLQQCMIDGSKESTTTEQSQDQKTILVYGSDECSHCVDFKKKLDSAGYEYTFYDVEKNQSLADEMLLKVQESGFQGYISFPVVEVNGVVKVNPTLETVKQAL